MDKLNQSELILSPDHRIYHLNLRPEELADTVILVGDPQRVSKVGQHFDQLEFSTQAREFITYTGYIGNKRLSVISTGISTANVDIVMNELDALINIDFNTRTVKPEKKSLTICRLGTAGTAQADVPLDSFVASTHGIALSNLLHFYPYHNSEHSKQILEALNQFTHLHKFEIYPSIASGNPELIKLFEPNCISGMTATFPGFYGPQGRYLRIEQTVPDLISALGQFEFEGHRVMNFEMETAAMYALGGIFGHRCLSLSAILSDRLTGKFSTQAPKTVEKLITFALENITSLA